MTWFREIRRSKVKFGLLAAAIGLLFFLLTFVNTLSSTLLERFVGAIENTSADILAFDSDAQATIPASRLGADDVARVGDLEGIAAVAPISVLTTDARHDGSDIDIALWGVDFAGPGSPADLVEGRSPGEGEALVDTTARDEGVGIGATLDVGGVEIPVVGVAGNATYAVTPTVYVTNQTWDRVFSELYPQAPFAPINLVGVEVSSDADTSEVAAAITGLDGLEGLTPVEAAASTPGVSAISQSFNLITGITFVIVAVVVGFFFQILTVQKLRVFALFEALGSRFRTLVGYVMTQIGFLVTLGVVIGVGILGLAVIGTRDVFAISIDPFVIAAFGCAILLASLLSGITSIRRIAKQDAAAVATGGAR